MIRFFYTSLVLLAFLATASCSRTTIYIVRHAEKDTLQKDDPPLTAKGMQRAQDLAILLKDKPITFVYSTDLKRTLATVRPTAAEHHLSIVTYDSIPQLMKLLSYSNNKNILIAGHSNTILQIAAALGAKPERKNIEDHDYDNLLILSKKHFLFFKHTSLEETTYGVPTDP